MICLYVDDTEATTMQRRREISTCPSTAAAERKTDWFDFNIEFSVHWQGQKSQRLWRDGACITSDMASPPKRYWINPFPDNWMP